MSVRPTSHASTRTGRLTLRFRNRAGDTTTVPVGRLPKSVAFAWPWITAYSSDPDAIKAVSEGSDRWRELRERSAAARKAVKR